MRRQLIINLILGSLSCVGGAAFAHHHGNSGTVAALSEETEELSSQTYAAYNLSWQAKNAVSVFVNDERYLVQCVESMNALYQPGVPYNCQSYLQRARSDFDGVVYYLSDATDYPYVYSAYQETREALESIP